MLSQELPFIASWANLINMVLVSVLALMLFPLAWFFFKYARDWTVPKQDAKLRANEAGLEQLRNETGSLRGRVNHHDLRLNGLSGDMARVKEHLIVLDDRVQGISEEQTRLTLEHDQNHPKWEGEN